ncbi:unnamed protein product [Paramecium sonneborni]|uniref:Uncharacterized protein n=1 Tax=Paramecium sonneborni TaxID=65129 RepID=A0A8S1QUS0_9CILI|nr:unnamed protein product [Paramecium sonneborni]
MENQRITKYVKSTSSLNFKQSSKYIQQSNSLNQKRSEQIIKKALQQNIPLIPLKQISNVLPTRETPIFKQNHDERYSYTKDANCLISKLDSLREIKSADSPIRSHVSPVPSTLQSVIVLNQNNAPKIQQLQQVASSSCVEPFKIFNNNKNATHSQQLSQTLPSKKNYETMIETLMKEQEVLVKQYTDQIKLLEQKTQVFSNENNNLIQQNKQYLEQNSQLNEEINHLKSKQTQINSSQSQLDTQITIEFLENQLDQKKNELNQLIQNMNEIVSNNQKSEERNYELSQQINTILEQKEKEINAYFTQITIYKQTIQDLELKIAQLIQNDQSQQKALKEAQNKTVNIEQQEKIKQNLLNSQQQLKINVKETFEYKQLALELDSKNVTVTEKENQIETLKIKNSMIQQQLAQTQVCQTSLKENQEVIIQLERENDNLKQNLISKDEEIQKLSQQLKMVRKEKAKLSINLMNAGMANLVMLSQGQIQQEEITA